MGLGRIAKITSQHAAPAPSGTQTSDAPPLARTTFTNAGTAPAQSGSRRRPRMNLSHLGTAEVASEGGWNPVQFQKKSEALV